MATFEENIQAARDSGASDAEIAQHFAGSKNTEEQGFVSKYKHDEARSKMGKVEGALDDTEQFVRAHPMASAALGAGALAVGGAATALGAYALKERIRSNAEIRTAEAIAKQPASEAVQLQKEQFAYKQQKDAQDELIRSEKQNRIDEITKGKNQIDAAKQQAVQQQAQTAKQNNLTPEQATARSLSLPPAGSPIVGGNPLPAGTPAPVAALPPTTPVQNAAVQLGADAPKGVLPPITRNALPVAPTSATGFTPPGTVSSAKAPMSIAAPDITGETGSAVKPKTRERLTYPDTPETWKTLTNKGITFLPGYGGGDNSLFNTYGAEGRKTVLERFNNGKPIGSDENYQKLLVKMRQGVPSSEVPNLMSKLPAAEEAGTYGKLGKKALKVGGIAGLGLAASELANAATSAKKGEYSKAGGQVAEVSSSFLPPWLQGMLYTKGAGAGEQEELAFQRRMQEASKKGAGNRGEAYDPRKFYTPMDTGSSMTNIGVAPPR